MESRRYTIILSFTIATTLLPYQFALAEYYSGKVVGISDGDTLTLLVDRQALKIRLAEIDTPESGQPYASRSQQALSSLAFGKQARVEVVDRDRYGRIVGRVLVDDLDVNAELIRQGAAWVYRKYARDHSLYALERAAQAARRGLWALPETERIPPWEWRRQRRITSSATKSAPSVAIASFRCGEKRYCKQMTSCAEARYFLDRCGLARLDGDKDGIPCEALCR